MKLSPFTLIYQPEGETAERQLRRSGSPKTKTQKRISDPRMQDARKRAPALVKALNALSPNLSRTLIASTYAQKAVTPTAQVTGRLKRVLSELQQSPQGVTVAIWDLDAKVSGLSEIVAAINKAQPIFTFFELRAPVPAGLVVRSDAFKRWALSRFGWHVTKKDEQEFKDNLLFDDFERFARVVRESIGVDYLVGITQQMVAFQEGRKVYWNYFSTYNQRVVLSSAYQMREFAKKAGRPLEVAIAGIVIAQLLQILSRKISYHENRGCLFDYNEERDTIVETIRKTEIDPQCLSLIDEKYRAAAEKMVKALRSYSSKLGDVDSGKSVKSSKGNKDDKYWLEQLTKLSERGAKTKAKGAVG